MEDESPNDYLHITRSQPVLFKRGDGYIIGCVVSETNEMTAEYKQYYEVIDESPSEKDVFKMLLERGQVRKYSEATVLSYE